MDTVINKLWEIEEAAGAIADEANVRKKAFAKEMEDKTASFDAGLEQETARRIADIGHKMEADMEAMLARQKSDFETLLKQLEDNYNRYHTAYADALFQKMIKE